MFHKILLPSDGSDLCVRAIEYGLQLAKLHGAMVIGFHAMPEYKLIPYEGWVPDPVTVERFEEGPKLRAQQILQQIEAAATAAGVPCELASGSSDHPWDAIVQAATERGCDLIVMASHGRRGLVGWLLGSETTKVLTHTNIPVLVYR
jgi:nucleotide-binding universal stress UspA family protein